MESPPDARTEAMGRAFSVLDRGPFSAWGNVGGLAFATGFQVSGSRAGLVANRADDANYYYASSLYSFNSLVVDVNITDLRVTNDLHFQFPHEELSESVFGVAGGLRLNRYVGVGIGLKRVSFRPGLDFSSSPYGNPQFDDVGPAFDGGLLALYPVPLGRSDQASLNLLGGITVRNIGPGLEKQWAGIESLPHEVLLAFGGEFRSGSDRGFEARGLARRDAPFLSISAGAGVKDSFSSLYSNRTDFMGGVEASLRRVFFLRAGYMTEEVFDNNGWTWGSGLAIRDRVGFDVARTLQFGERKRVTKLSLWLRIPGSSGGSN